MTAATDTIEPDIAVDLATQINRAWRWMCRALDQGRTADCLRWAQIHATLSRMKPADVAPKPDTEATLERVEKTLEDSHATLTKVMPVLTHLTRRKGFRPGFRPRPRPP